MDLGGFLGVCPVEELLTLFEAIDYTSSVKLSCSAGELERSCAPCGPDLPRDHSIMQFGSNRVICDLMSKSQLSRTLFVVIKAPEKKLIIPTPFGA